VLADPLDEAVAEVAAERGVDPDTLRADAEQLQRFAAEYDAVGGVDGLVYEWRTTFHEDPLVETTDRAYYLDPGERTWGDFADRLDLSDETRATVRAVHRQAFVAAVDAGTAERAAAPMVLTRR
jgi:hypothetical protein